MTPPLVLTIAAHDPLGGAGIAADLATFAALGTHGMVALTAVTAQRFGAVDRVVSIAPDMLAAQLDAIAAECRPDAMKVGLLFDAPQVEVVARRIADGLLPAPVVDPVMVDGRGNRFVSSEVEAACRELLFPLTAVLTPNRAEADLLGASPMALAALGAALVVVTGGDGDGIDRLISADGSVTELAGEWIDTVNVRGSGCTFAAALTAGLANGLQPADAAAAAKVFVAARLSDSVEWRIGGTGTTGPVSHRFG
jgi:hydroxymethylpyrimidine/phosphomethylpyrimidine kinase